MLKKFGLPDKRINKDEYDKVSSLIISELLQYGYAAAQCPKVISSKFDHGDVDILVNVGNGEKPLLNFVKEKFYATPHKNGNIISFPYDGIQIDLIGVGATNYEVAHYYFSYELGLGLGVISDKLGLKLGWDGLALKYPLNLISPELPAHEYFEIALTKDASEFFDILGVSKEKVDSGFATREDFFNWLADSKYFDPKIFNLDELNHRNKARNRKRATYNALVKYFKTMSEAKPRPTKEEVRSAMIERFPHAQAKIEEKSRQIMENKERAAKFNGNIVRELTGLEGAALGSFIKDFKAHYSVYMTFEVYLDDRTKEMVIADIRKMFDGGRKEDIVAT